jgi:CheY-like chemotaxis protein
MKKIIWIIDDDEAFRFLSLLSIEQAQLDSHIVREYTSALEAIEYLRRNTHLPENLPDIILLDINMPNMDGWRFLKA